MCLALIGVMWAGTARAATGIEHDERVRLQQVFRDELGKHDRISITKYLAHTDLGYGYEWCAAFVSYCFGRIGYGQPRTPWSPSLFPGSRLVWQFGDRRQEPQALSPGMVWGIYVHHKKRIGHVGFVDDYRNGLVLTVEGNTSDPEGRRPPGVYRKRRHWRTIHSVSDWLSGTGVITSVNNLKN